ncbi:MAG TPA: DUF5010 domain-containing protein [Polyangia bacterium]|jgi:hypothetical protein|nr:DUF5010 domain-containing protein [Polyangia bacterium]
MVKKQSSWGSLVGFVILVIATGCIRMPEVTGPAPVAAVHKEDATVVAPFQLKPDWDGPCARAEIVDVDLGNTPASFVRAAHCQVTGQPATDAVVTRWTARMRDEYYVRRIDVVRSLCKEAKRDCKLAYSDPWVAEPDLGGPPVRNTKREVGAVLMFFFDCPGKTNCSMDWANTHAPGMDGPVPSLGMKPGESAPYHPSQPGFWRRELLDAKYAGLSFLMPNAYGPDMEDGKLAPLEKALESIDDPVKIALFDDTWTWGQHEFSDFWTHKPDLANTDDAAKKIYEHKWKPFFSQVNKKYWYRFHGRPFIYWYNAGTLEPRGRSAAVVAKLKELFKADFGEEPFVDVDIAYFDDPAMSDVADGRFKWMTFDIPQRRYRAQLGGHVIDHAMVRWDAIDRDRPGDVATKYDRCVKGGQILQRVLKDSQDAELLVLATWNDLGEGTGVNRNYDYWVDGHWLPPHYFMQLIRNSQRDGKR